MSAEARLRLEAIPASGAPAGTAQALDLPESGVLRLGRDPRRCEFALEGQGVAAVHCAIGRLKDGGWALKDLGSERGTLVNGERSSSVRLRAGDEIVLGTRRLRVVDPAQPATPTTTPKPTASPQTGPSITGYRIGKLLGRGGMGEVYAAVQESLQRPVALKVVSARFEADREFVDRFVAEARAAAALSHPNVVTVHDVGEEAGQHYLSMEFMEGGNLEERVTLLGPLPIREAIGVLADATKGLVFAELRGIVHRDIKPANLMRDGFGNTKIADLGLATQITAQEEGDRKIFGTPHFISPEQARGERVDCRSDLYSLGATVYRLLSGRTPFEGQTTREILRGHFQERPRPLEQLVPGIPPALAQLVARLLEKDPAQRYPSASALLLEIEHLRSTAHGGALAGQPTATGAAGAHGANAPSGARRGTWVAVAVAVAALAAVLWVATSGSESGAEPEQQLRNATPAVREPQQDPQEGTVPALEVAEGQPATPDEGNPVDDDSALKVLERRAEEAYAELPADLTRAEREVALAQLSRDFAGTTAAGRWSDEASALATVETPPPAPARPGDEQLQALRQASGPAGGQAARLADAWPALLAVSLPPALETDPEFQAQRALLLDAALVEGLRDAEQRVTAIDEHAALGEFESVETGLRDTLAALGDPTLPAGLLPAQLPHLLNVSTLRSSLAERLELLNSEREAFAQQQIHLDGLALAAGFGGLEQELASLEFDAASTRLADLEGHLVTEPARVLVRQVRSAVAGGRLALSGLTAEFQADGWRRLQAPDPRSRKRTSHATLGVDERGLRLRIGSSEQRVAWAAFGAQPEALHHLFHERLKRDYTPAELLDIAGLLRLSAVVRAARTGARRLSTGVAAGPGRDQLAGFEQAQLWADLAGAPELNRRETAAVQAFGEALDAAEAGSWSRSVALLELLFEDYEDTLFVRLLSDGSGWKPGPEEQ